MGAQGARAGGDVQADLQSRSEVDAAVRRLTAPVVADIDGGRPAVRVGIKVRLRPFVTLQRSLTLPEPADPEVLAAAAVLAARPGARAGARGRCARRSG
ncbi:MAG: hypothetical protein R2734_14810 [Nocardioides sp.]